jgi:hypothetical protein
MGSVKQIRPLHNANLNSQGGAESWVNGIRETHRGPQLWLTSTRSSIPINIRALLYLGPNVPGEVYRCSVLFFKRTFNRRQKYQ